MKRQLGTRIFELLYAQKSVLWLGSTQTRWGAYSVRQNYWLKEGEEQGREGKRGERRERGEKNRRERKEWAPNVSPLFSLSIPDPNPIPDSPTRC